MTSRAALPPVSDDQLVRVLTPITIAFCGALVVVGLLGLFVLVPDPTVSPAGLAVGAALGAAGWFGSRVVPGAMLDRAWALRTGRDGTGSVATSAAGSDTAVVQTVAFVALAIAELPGLLGLVIAFLWLSEVGPLVVAVPVSIAAVALNASGPSAVRRHLARLRGTPSW